MGDPGPETNPQIGVSGSEPARVGEGGAAGAAGAQPTVDLETWFDALRARFFGFARRRVAPDAVDDVVQEALAIVVRKGVRWPETARVDDLPAIGWCFQVLHHTIGNHYQRERTRARHLDPRSLSGAEGAAAAAAAGAPQSVTPLEALEIDEARELVHAAIRELGGDPCARYLTQLLQGLKPAQVAREEKVMDAAMYRRLYRCRQKLRAILERRGLVA